MDLRGWLSGLSRWQKWALGLSIAVFVYGIVGFLVLPPIVRSQAEDGLREELNREARIGEVRINPFLLSVQVRDFELPDRDGAPFVSFDELFVDFEVSSIWHQAFTFREIRVAAPFVHVKVMPDGLLNFADILEGDPEDDAEAEDPEDDSPPALLIALAAIQQGRVVFSDFSHQTPFEHEISPLDVELRDFGTRPDDESPYSFAATTGAGEALEWQGRVSVVPLYSSGELQLTGIRPRTGWRYVQDSVYFEVVDGTVDFNGRYDLDARDGLKVRLEDAHVQIRSFAVAERESGETAVSIPEFDIDGIAIQYPEQTVKISEISSRGGRYHLVRFEDGKLRAERLSRQKSDEVATSAPGGPAGGVDPVEPAEPWSVAIDAIRLAEYQVDFDDRATTPPVSLTLAPIAIELTDVTTDPTRPIGVALGIGIDDGRIDVEGDVRAEPLEVGLAIEVADIDLRPFEPYAQEALAIELASGRAGLAGRLEVRDPASDGPRVAYTGGFRVDDLRTLDRRLHDDLLSWEALALEGLDLQIEPTSVALEKLSIVAPEAHVVLAPDGTSNLANLAVPPAEGEAPAADAGADASAAEPVPVEVTLVEIEKGFAGFEDRTISPRFSTAVSSFGGTIEGLSSDVEKRAKVSLAGKLDRATPMRISGVLSPLSQKTYADIVVGLENFELSPFTPYSGRYVGREIDQGKLFVELDYTLDGNVLSGENKLFLDQFSLGSKVESEEATNLPIGLAVGLLKDRNGEIHIDLPVRGEVDDPEFSVGGLVLGALGNLITKVAASPFSMLGRLAGSDGESMRFIAFEPGSAALTPAEISKLEALSGALAERPALSLELTGGAAVELDRPALQAQAFELDLRRRRFRELQSKWFGDKPESVDEVVLEPEERSKLVAKVFEETFGQKPDQLVLPAAEGGQPAVAAEGGEAAVAAAREAEMVRRLEGEMDVDQASLLELANDRASAIRDHMVDVGGIPPARIFVLDPSFDESAEEGARTTMALAAH